MTNQPINQLIIQTMLEYCLHVLKLSDQCLAHFWAGLCHSPPSPLPLVPSIHKNISHCILLHIVFMFLVTHEMWILESVTMEFVVSSSVFIEQIAKDIFLKTVWHYIISGTIVIYFCYLPMFITMTSQMWTAVCLSRSLVMTVF